MWTNWAGDQACQPVVHERPASRDEVLAAVQRAAAAGRTVRAAGTGHSFSDCALSDGTLITLERMCRVLDVDAAGGRVRVEAGVPLHALTRALHERGLALPNLGDIDRQTVGGAVATATHGTGGRRFNLSAQVAAVEMVCGDGEVREVEDGDLLLAARVSTGSLGVATAFTLDVVPAFRLHGVDEPQALDEVLESLEERVDANDHFEFWTFPHTNVAFCRTNNATDRPLHGPPEWRLRAEQVWLDNRLYEAMLRVGRRRRSAIAPINRAIPRVLSRRERVAWSWQVFASPRLFRFTEMEYAVPREHAAEAVLGAREILERHPNNMPIELRFVGADEALLSPSHGRDTAYIAVHAYERMPYRPIFREVEAMMSGLDGRPHWGKRSWLTAEELAPRYPRWDDFQAARAQLDPHGRFTNAYAERLLGPPRAAPAPAAA